MLSDYVATVADAGNSNITVSGSGSETAAVTLDLTDSGVSAASYGSQTAIPVITVDAKGRITTATTASVGSGLTVAGDSGSDTIDLLSETLTIAGGTNITSAVASDTATLNLDPNISLTSVTASGTFTGDLTGDVTGDVTGNLTGEVNAAAFDTNASGVVVTGVTTSSSGFVGNLTGEVNAAALDTNADGVVVTGVTTSSGGFSGNLTGNVVGNVTGDVTGNADSATKVKTVNTPVVNATHYITFVDSDNSSANAETVKTDSGLYYNPFLNQFSANGVNTGVLSLNSVDVTATAAELNVLDGVTAFVDEDDMSSDSATSIPSQQSVKAYVDGQVASGLTVTGDSGSENILLRTEGLAVTGGDHVTTAAASNGVNITVDATSANTNSTIVARNEAGGFVAGIVTASAVHLGAEGSAMRMTSDTISGPSTLNIDPDGVGDNTGTVVIKGNLQIDGTTTTVNSTTVNIDDKNIQIATGAANDAAADGAGITVNSGDGNITFNWVDNTDAWTSSEHMDLASGKSYFINGNSVLSADTLGSAVVNSSLTSVGTLTALTVSGNITANGNIAGDGSTNITGMDGVTANTFTGALTGNVTGNLTGNVTGNVYASSGISTFNNIEIDGTLTDYNDGVGSDGQILVTTGISVSWKNITDALPQTRTTATATATAGQTAFTFAYNVNYLDVFLNGVKLASSEYTATNGSTITLSEAAFAGDLLEFFSYNTAGTGSGTVSSFNDLSDGSLSSPSSNDILVYNGSAFVNQQTLNLSGNVTAGSFTGNVTGDLTGDVTGNADTATVATNAQGLTGTPSITVNVATASSFSTGASGSAIGINTNTISGPSTLTLDPAGVGDNTGTVVIAGNLQVDGTTTTINSTTMTVDDLNIVLASGAGNASAANGAGLTIDGASATFTYASTGDKFVSNKDVEAPNFNATSDITLKENVSIIDGALDMINNLEGISWNWKSDGRASLGVSAQNVETVAPQLVTKGSAHKAVNYNGLIGILIEAVKEQSNQINDLRHELSLKANSRRKRK